MDLCLAVGPLHRMNHMARWARSPHLVGVGWGREHSLCLVEPRLRIALVAHFGPERGRAATAEALAYAWENWESVEQMDYPIAYLCKVGRSKTRTHRAIWAVVPGRSSPRGPDLD